MTRCYGDIREARGQEGRATWRRVPRNPALDGLRGVAIAVVALFHYPTHSVFRGGLFGVGVFFVLSGFLITPILAEEHERLGRVRLRRFYWKRAWRLLPALIVFLTVFLVLAAAFGRDGWFQSNPFGPPRSPGPPLHMPSALTSVGAGLGYIYNFFLAHGFHLASPLGHLWTLSVEGQFYIVWALAVPRMLKSGPRLLVGATAALVAASALAPFLRWPGAGHHSWIYFSTGPRIQQLLTGALLAEIWSLGWLSRIPSWALRVAGTAGAVVFAYLVFEVGDVPLKYVGGLTITAGAGVLIVMYLVEERGPSLSRQILGSRPLVWLGTRSYAVYLWHWPLAMWTNELPHRVGVPLGIGCSLIAAELSWRLVEVPAQRLSRRWDKAAQPVPGGRPPARVG